MTSPSQSLRRTSPSIAAIAGSLLLCFGAAGFAAVPKKGARYVGTSGPGFPLHFKVSKDGKSVEKMVFRFDPTCESGVSSTSAKFSFGSRPIRGGKFSGFSVQHRGPTVTLTLRVNGHFESGGSASGEVTATSQVKSLGKCKESSPFTAAIP